MTINEELMNAYKQKTCATDEKIKLRKEKIHEIIDKIMEHKDAMDAILATAFTAYKETDFFRERGKQYCSWFEDDPLYADGITHGLGLWHNLERPTLVVFGGGCCGDVSASYRVGGFSLMDEDMTRDYEIDELVENDALYYHMKEALCTFCDHLSCYNDKFYKEINSYIYSCNSMNVKEMI